MPLDPQAQRYLERMQELGAPPIEQLSPETARADAERQAAALFGPVDEVGSITDGEVDGVPVRSYLPSTTAGEGGELPLVVYLHGGGWVTGSLETVDGICRALAARVPCRVVSVDYRLAPEHRFPAAVEDAWTVTRWALEQARRVAMAGDSAGGTLAAVMAVRARDQGLPLRFQLLIYPVMERRFDTESYAANATGYGLTQAAMRWYWDHYLGGSDGSHPEASPLLTDDLSGLAPTRIVVCEYDPLRDEGVAYADRLRQAGVAVQLSEYEGMIHGFLRLGAFIDRSQDVLNESAQALRDALIDRPQPAPSRS